MMINQSQPLSSCHSFADRQMQDIDDSSKSPFCDPNKNHQHLIYNHCDQEQYGGPSAYCFYQNDKLSEVFKSPLVSSQLSSTWLDPTYNHSSNYAQGLDNVYSHNHSSPQSLSDKSKNGAIFSMNQTTMGNSNRKRDYLIYQNIQEPLHHPSPTPDLNPSMQSNIRTFRSKSSTKSPQLTQAMTQRPSNQSTTVNHGSSCLIPTNSQDKPNSSNFGYHSAPNKLIFGQTNTTNCSTNGRCHTMMIDSQQNGQQAIQSSQFRSSKQPSSSNTHPNSIGTKKSNIMLSSTSNSATFLSSPSVLNSTNMDYHMSAENSNCDLSNSSTLPMINGGVGVHTLTSPNHPIHSTSTSHSQSQHTASYFPQQEQVHYTPIQQEQSSRMPLHSSNTNRPRPINQTKNQLHSSYNTSHGDDNPRFRVPASFSPTPRCPKRRRTEEMRQKHNKISQKGRQKINEEITRLKYLTSECQDSDYALVNSGNVSTCNKAAILHNAVSHLEKLINYTSNLWQHVLEIHKQNRQLWQSVQQMSVEVGQLTSRSSNEILIIYGFKSASSDNEAFQLLSCPSPPPIISAPRNSLNSTKNSEYEDSNNQPINVPLASNDNSFDTLSMSHLNQPQPNSLLPYQKPNKSSPSQSFQSQDHDLKDSSIFQQNQVSSTNSFLDQSSRHPQSSLNNPSPKLSVHIPCFDQVDEKTYYQSSPFILKEVDASSGQFVPNYVGSITAAATTAPFCTNDHDTSTSHHFKCLKHDHANSSNTNSICSLGSSESNASSSHHDLEEVIRPGLYPIGSDLSSKSPQGTVNSSSYSTVNSSSHTDIQQDATTLNPSYYLNAVTTTGTQSFDLSMQMSTLHEEIKSNPQRITSPSSTQSSQLPPHPSFYSEATSFSDMNSLHSYCSSFEYASPSSSSHSQHDSSQLSTKSLHASLSSPSHFLAHRETMTTLNNPEPEPRDSCSSSSATLGEGIIFEEATTCSSHSNLDQADYGNDDCIDRMNISHIITDLSQNNHHVGHSPSTDNLSSLSSTPSLPSPLGSTNSKSLLTSPEDGDDLHLSDLNHSLQPVSETFPSALPTDYSSSCCNHSKLLESDSISKTSSEEQKHLIHQVIHDQASESQEPFSNGYLLPPCRLTPAGSTCSQGDHVLHLHLNDQLPSSPSSLHHDDCGSNKIYQSDIEKDGNCALLEIKPSFQDVQSDHEKGDGEHLNDECHYAKFGSTSYSLLMDTDDNGPISDLSIHPQLHMELGILNPSNHHELASIDSTSVVGTNSVSRSNTHYFATNEFYA